MNKNKIFYHKNLLVRKLNSIKKFRYGQEILPSNIKVTESFKSEVIEKRPDDKQFMQIEIPYNYGGIDDYMWTVAEFNNLKPDTTYYGVFDFGKGSAGLTCGAETLLYLHDQEHSGVDLNHQEIYLGTLQNKEQLVFRTWSGIADETRLNEMESIQGKRCISKIHTLSCLKIVELDETVNNLYYNFKAIYEAALALEEKNKSISERLINDLVKIFLKYDEEDITRELITKLDHELQIVIDSYEKDNLVQMYAMGQTHIDLAWLWRVKHTREKAARSFSTMLNLMEQNEEFTFFQSQPQLLAFLKNDYPDIYRSMQEAVKRQQLEIDGAMWLESDCNIPSGESLTRQILYGKEYIKKEFNSDSKVLWMPDVFGYSWAMPQILKKSGVDVFCTTKMQWNQYNRMPFNTFEWIGIDGTSVTTHLIEDFNFFDINAKSMLSGWDEYKDKDLSNELLYQYGFGDGGGGPRQEDIEMVKRFDKIPGLPNIEYKKGSEFFKELDQKVNLKETYVHKWDGELYLELHRGTFTSQAKMKKLNRRLEYRLRYIEMLTVHCHKEGIDVIKQAKEIKDVWKKVLLNQFHDIIPGSSIASVYDDASLLYDECNQKLDSIEQELLTSFEKSDNQIYAYNSFHLAHTKVIEYASDKNLEFYNGDKKLRSTYTNGKYKIVVENMAPFSFTPIEFKEVPNIKENKLLNDVGRLNFETKFYIIEFKANGQIVRLYDKELNRELVTDGRVFNKLVSYEDKPLMWDAWDIDIFYDKRERVVDEVGGHKVICENEIETIVEFKLKHFETEIVERITLSNLTKRIDIKHDVEYKSSHRLLRVLFETDVRNVNARYDIQYGNVLRPTHRNTSWDMQRFEVLAHKWADLSNNSYGISILNDCKYGYSVDDSTIGLSLIKAAKFPDESQDIGTHQYTYSIYPHSGDVLESNVELEAHMLNEMQIVYNNQLPLTSIFNSDMKNIHVDAIKISEDMNSVIVRLHENGNQISNLDLDSNYFETNLLEEGRSNLCELGCYEVKTLIEEIN